MLNVRVQDMRNLRLQLNTESHDSIDRSLGTQAQKLAYANINDDDVINASEYQEEISGKDIKDEMLGILNRVSEIKYNRLRSIFSTT
mgnify:CR=1 FL=1